jgi:BASS family bile acid:Na+ symporter
VLLLTGISTGVVAPFMGVLVEADLVTVLRMVVITSVLVPFSLPALVKIMAGAEVTISLWTMIRMLALVIFLPMAAVLLARRIAPRLLATIGTYQFPISMVLFSMVNFGVFSRYSSFFFAHPGQIVVSVGVAYVLSVVYYAAGFALTVRQETSHRMAAGISLAILNNVLVIIFSSEFFGPLSPTLAAMYMLPYYTMIVPAKLVAQSIGTYHNQGCARR